MNLIIYDNTGKILRQIQCPSTLSLLQAKKGEFVMEGVANDSTQKIVAGKVVDKTPEEIEADNPPTPERQNLVLITRGQWQDVLDRLDKLEIR